MDRLTTDVDDLLKRLTASVDRLFRLRVPIVRHWDLFCWTFDHSLVVEELLGTPKVVGQAWASQWSGWSGPGSWLPPGKGSGASGCDAHHPASEYIS